MTNISSNIFMLLRRGRVGENQPNVNNLPALADFTTASADLTWEVVRVAIDAKVSYVALKRVDKM